MLLETNEPRSARNQNQGNTLVRDGIVEFDQSIYKNLTLPTIASLSRVAEDFSDALRHFPDGSKLVLSADGDPGNAWENGYLIVYIELKLPSQRGRRSSGKECIYRNDSGSLPGALRSYLKSLLGPPSRTSAALESLAPPPRPVDPVSKFSMSQRVLHELSGPQLQAVVDVVSAAEGRLANLPDDSRLALSLKGKGEILYSMGEGEYAPAKLALELSYTANDKRKSIKHEVAPADAKPAEMAQALQKEIELLTTIAVRGF